MIGKVNHNDKFIMSGSELVFGDLTILWIMYLMKQYLMFAEKLMHLMLLDLFPII